MSQNGERASGEVLGGPITDSVYDFLYHDARRVASFVAQIDPSGHLTSLKQTETAESGSGMKSSANVSGNVAVARGGAALEDQRTVAERESLERTYDPLWANALALLDMLDERGMLHNGLASARIGSFVKVSGSLAISDLTMWKGIWSLPALKQILTANAVAERQAMNQQAVAATPNRAERRRTQAGKQRPEPTGVLESQLDGALALAGMLPHTVQARLVTDERELVWCSLREDGMVVSASDLTLKHGMTVSGRWTMVGVLDALPDLDKDGNATENAIQTLAEAPLLSASSFDGIMTNLTPAIRGLLGRPLHAYGMTPLVIFRQVTA